MSEEEGGRTHSVKDRSTCTDQIVSRFVAQLAFLAFWNSAGVLAAGSSMLVCLAAAVCTALGLSPSRISAVLGGSSVSSTTCAGASGLAPSVTCRRNQDPFQPCRSTPIDCSAV